MKPISVKLPQDIEKIRLYPLADLHIGDRECDMGLLRKKVEEIAADERSFVVLGGDIINNAVKSGVSDVYAERLSPMDEMERACEILSPISGKVLAAVPGNHEERTYRQDGIDITALIARQLGFYDKYRPEFAYLFLSFGRNSRRAAAGRRQSYTVFVNHGNGGGRKIGGKANRLADLGSICDADLFIVGHTHTPMVFKDNYLRSERCSGGIEPVERTFINTSAFLNYGGYGARNTYQPTAKSLPCVLLDGTKRKIDVLI